MAATVGRVQQGNPIWSVVIAYTAGWLYSIRDHKLASVNTQYKCTYTVCLNTLQQSNLRILWFGKCTCSVCVIGFSAPLWPFWWSKPPLSRSASPTHNHLWQLGWKRLYKPSWNTSDLCKAEFYAWLQHKNKHTVFPVAVLNLTITLLKSLWWKDTWDKLLAMSRYI